MTHSRSSESTFPKMPRLLTNSCQNVSIVAFDLIKIKYAASIVSQSCKI